MKKHYTLVLSLYLFSFIASKAQDTLLLQDFQFHANGYHITIDSVAITPATTADTLWYTFDLDLIPDASTGTPRSDAWFALRPFADVDRVQTQYFDSVNMVPDSNIVFAANSWNNNGETAAGLEDNWLVSPSVTLGTHDTLYWKSAPRQTPRYCDGYEVLLSTTNNDPLSFTTVLFTAAEMTAILGTNDSVFSGYSFGPSGAFIHGIDGTYTENHADSARLVGVLRPFTAALDAYSGQTVFVAFHHNSHDDNLISIDDVIIGSNVYYGVVGVNESANDLGLKLSPNPASESAQICFSLTTETSVLLNVYDITGNLVLSENKGSISQGYHTTTLNTSALAKGFYTVAVQINKGRSIVKLVVQ